MTYVTGYFDLLTRPLPALLRRPGRRRTPCAASSARPGALQPGQGRLPLDPRRSRVAPRRLRMNLLPGSGRSWPGSSSSSWAVSPRACRTSSSWGSSYQQRAYAYVLARRGLAAVHRRPCAPRARAVRARLRRTRDPGAALRAPVRPGRRRARAAAPGRSAWRSRSSRRGSGGAGARRARGGRASRSDSLWPMTSRTPIPKRQRSHRVRRSDARSWRRSPSTSPSRKPTCSMPIAVQFSPTVCRHMTPSGTSCHDRAVAADDEVAARPGQLVELGVGHVRARRRRRSLAATR